MRKSNDTDNVIIVNGTDYELFFATEVLKLKSLHYGYLKPNQKLTFDGITSAQKNYTESLIKIIPNGVKKILDVGCGIGDNAKAMSEKGYQVVAISPDKNHKKFFEKINSKNLKFINSDLQNFKSDQEFDMFLLSESQSYFDPEITFKKASQYLNLGGYILVSDMFSRSPKEHLVGFTEKEYINEARKNGFKLVTSIDITNNILPTVKFMNSVYVSNILPLFNMISSYYRNSSPLKYFFISLFLRKQIKDASKLKAYWDSRLYPKSFTKSIVYKRLLFKRVS